jgi:hypothetical protein
MRAVACFGLNRTGLRVSRRRTYRSRPRLGVLRRSVCSQAHQGRLDDVQSRLGYGCGHAQDHDG